jgi:hypothetical protein
MPDNIESVRQSTDSITFDRNETWIGDLILCKAKEVGIELTFTDRGQAGRIGFMLYYPRQYSEVIGITITQIRVIMMWVNHITGGKDKGGIGFAISELVEVNLRSFADES